MSLSCSFDFLLYSISLLVFLFQQPTDILSLSDKDVFLPPFLLLLRRRGRRKVQSSFLPWLDIWIRIRNGSGGQIELCNAFGEYILSFTLSNSSPFLQPFILFPFVFSFCRPFHSILVHGLLRCVTNSYEWLGSRAEVFRILLVLHNENYGVFVHNPCTYVKALPLYKMDTNFDTKMLHMIIV